jgi:glutamyl/glutaminyl-tRNA synthetase
LWLTEPPVEGFTTRFAPAPTGFLHLGHVASAIAVWGVARAFRGRVLLRIEDHDLTRSRAEYERAILEDLEWLGFLPDEPFVRQSARGPIYANAWQRLQSHGLVYACECSRKAIDTASISGIDGELRYGGLCRGKDLPLEGPVSHRLRLEPKTVAFLDLRLGDIEQKPFEQCGDVPIRDRQGQWTYQFAASVDDFEQGINLVIRGEDLLASTGRQIQIADLLGRKSKARFLHHPLIMRSDGQKLSKSNRDTGIRDLRSAGLSVESVLGQAAAALELTRGEPIDHERIVERIRAGSGR